MKKNRLTILILVNVLVIAIVGFMFLNGSVRVAFDSNATADKVEASAKPADDVSVPPSVTVASTGKADVVVAKKPVADVPAAEGKPVAASTPEVPATASSQQSDTPLLPSNVQIYEPAKPKPLGVVPSGWQLRVIKDRVAETLPISLPNGRTAEIASLPYLLEPSNERGFFAIQEPGYDPAKGAASETVGKILADQSAAMAAQNARLKSSIADLRKALNDCKQQQTQQQGKENHL